MTDDVTQAGYTGGYLDEYGFGSRERIAVHEAGHAVAHILTGWPIERLALAPSRVATRNGVDGLVILSRDEAAEEWYLSRRWESAVVGTAAGMAASAAYNVVEFGAEKARLFPGYIAAEGGSGSEKNGGDMPALRWMARVLWHVARGEYSDKPENHDLGPNFDPAWGATPEGVERIAEWAWARAVELLCANWPAVWSVAQAADKSRRALTHRQIAELMACAPAVVSPDPDDVGTDFWPRLGSRLVWRPRGQCRPTKPAPLVLAAMPADRPTPAVMPARRPDRTGQNGAGQNGAGQGRVVQAHVVLDWRDPKHFGRRRLPCRVCRALTFVRDDQGRPCDKACAEAELAAEILRQHGAYFADERVQPGQVRPGTPAAGGAR